MLAKREAVDCTQVSFRSPHTFRPLLPWSSQVSLHPNVTRVTTFAYLHERVLNQIYFFPSFCCLFFPLSQSSPPPRRSSPPPLHLTFLGSRAGAVVRALPPTNVARVRFKIPLLTEVGASVYVACANICVASVSQSKLSYFLETSFLFLLVLNSSRNCVR